MKKNERVRVNMRLPAELVRWARKYSKRHGKTFTSAVERGLQMYRNETEWRSDEVAIVEEVLRQHGRPSTISR